MPPKKAAAKAAEAPKAEAKAEAPKAEKPAKKAPKAEAAAAAAAAPAETEAPATATATADSAPEAAAAEAAGEAAGASTEETKSAPKAEAKDEKKAPAKAAKKEKKEEKDPSLMLGRPGNSVSIGLVGLPNVGKSSLFNLLSGLQVPAENYPFCTIKPSTATVPVPDARYSHLKEFWKPKSQIQAVLTVTDIAGLVKGAAEGKGLGNAFLANIQAVDAIFHVTRGFLDTEVEHVEGTVNPVRDFDIIKEELIKKDLAQMEGRVADLEKKCRQNGKDKASKDDLEVARKCLTILQEGKEIRFGEWASKEILYVNRQQLLTAKPVVYLINIGDKNFTEQKSKFLKDVKTWVTEHAPGDSCIPFSVAFEQRIAGMEEADRKAYLAEHKVPSMVDKIITTGYKALNLIQYFTTGADEVRCWSIRRGTKAPAAAGVIHGDFEKGFICAEQYNYDDFKEFGSEAGAKAAGRCRTQGREYVVKDGDILFFKHNARK